MIAYNLFSLMAGNYAPSFIGLTAIGSVYRCGLSAHGTCVCDHCVMRIETDQCTCTCTCTCLFHLGHFIVRGKPGKQFLSVVYKGKPTHHRIEDSDGVLTLNKKKYGTTPSSNVPDLIATLSKKCKGWPVVLIAAVSTPVAGEGDYGDTAAVTLSARTQVYTALHFRFAVHLRSIRAMI